MLVLMAEKKRGEGDKWVCPNHNPPRKFTNAVIFALHQVACQDERREKGK